VIFIVGFPQYSLVLF